MKKRKVLVVFLIFSFLILPRLVSAQIAINERSGNLSITTPDGQLTTITTRDVLPSLLSGSVIEVLSGNVGFELESASSFTLVAGESVMNLSGGHEIKVNVSNNGADTLINVVTGDIEIYLGEVILVVMDETKLQAQVTEGKVTVAVAQGDARIVELDGYEYRLENGKSYNLGSIVPAL